MEVVKIIFIMQFCYLISNNAMKHTKNIFKGGILDVFAIKTIKEN